MPETITQYASSEVVPLPEDVAIDSNLEALRQILSVEQNRDVKYEEATDIGQSLIDFFNILAGAS